MILSPDSPRVAHLDWTAVIRSLNERGYAILGNLLSPNQCGLLAAKYDDESIYRSTVIMQRHGFGSGEYKYYAYPLPGMIAQIRSALYPYLAPIANQWNALLAVDYRYPACLDEFLERCHAAGQIRPTPLILRYRRGDYNCLHQDLYGEEVFPLQVAVLLSRPGEDFTGGEFIVTEGGSSQRRAEIVALRQGDAVLFTVNQRPVQGVRTYRKVAMRHGVCEVRSGNRFTVGFIFHDAL
jgi:hypothetical protein